MVWPRRAQEIGSAPTGDAVLGIGRKARNIWRVYVLSRGQEIFDSSGQSSSQSHSTSKGGAQRGDLRWLRRKGRNVQLREKRAVAKEIKEGNDPERKGHSLVLGLDLFAFGTFSVRLFGGHDPFQFEPGGARRASWRSPAGGRRRRPPVRCNAFMHRRRAMHGASRQTLRRPHGSPLHRARTSR